MDHVPLVIHLPPLIVFLVLLANTSQLLENASIAMLAAAVQQLEHSMDQIEIVLKPVEMDLTSDYTNVTMEVLLDALLVKLTLDMSVLEEILKIQMFVQEQSLTSKESK